MNKKAYLCADIDIVELKTLFTMPRTARDQSAAGIYHVMIRGINRQEPRAHFDS